MTPPLRRFRHNLRDIIHNHDIIADKLCVRAFAFFVLNMYLEVYAKVSISRLYREKCAL